MSGPVDFEFRFGRAPAGPNRGRGDGPLRILVLGDFGGTRTGRGGGLAGRPIVPVDADSIDAVLARLAPGLDLAMSDPTGFAVQIDIRQFDDFHPDALYDGLTLFRQVRELRRRLLDPAQFAAAAAELRLLPAAPGALPPPAAGDEDEAATVARLLGRGPVQPAAPPPGAVARSEVARFIARIVAPHIVPGADPRQQELVASVDAATAAAMRAVLHHPAFQALEAAWRGLHWLVESVGFGGEVELALLDVGRQELAEDLAASARDLSESGLYRLLAGRGVGSRPWSVLLGLYRFGPSAGDVALLAALGAVAARTGGPFLAEADPAVLGCRSLVETPDPADWTATDAEAARRWQALRRSGVAPWLGLALPRVMLRRPYGKRSDPIERFAFEEIAPDSGPEAFLWGNPALACAIAFARAFLDSGWAMRPGDAADLDGLPLHSFDDDGERRMLPCAEVLLGERAAATMLGRGVIPVLSHRNKNAVRIARIQSLADPVAPLSGPWR